MASEMLPQPNLTTGERPLAYTKQEVIKEAKRIEEDALYSSKGHFAAAQFWANFHLWIGIPIVALAAFGAAFIFADTHRSLAGVLALAVAILSAVATFLNPNERAGIYLTSGNNYSALRNKTRIFWTVECWRENATEAIIAEKLKELSEEGNKLSLSCPQIPRWAYKIGKKGIAAGEGSYAVDKQ